MKTRTQKQGPVYRLSWNLMVAQKQFPAIRGEEEFSDKLMYP